MVYPFGILLLGYMLKYMVIGKRKSLEEVHLFFLSLLIALELFVNVGFFIRIGSYELLYDELLFVIVAFISILAMIKHWERIKLKASMIFFILSLSATEIYLFLNPIGERIYRNGHYVLPAFSMYSIMVAMKVILLVLISVFSLDYIQGKQLEKLTKQLLHYGAIAYVIIGVEWIVKNIFHSSGYHSLVNLLFGKGAYTVDFLLRRGSGFSIQGLHREPADLTFGLFIFLIIVVLSGVSQRTKNRYLAIGILYLVISGSFSGIGYAMAVMLAYLLTTKRRIKPAFFALSFIFMLVLLVPNDLFTYYFNRVMNSIQFLGLGNNQPLSTSEQVRLFSIMETIRTVFIKRPLLGAGLGIPYAYSAMVMILSSIGVLGGGTWFWYYFVSIGKAKGFLKIMLLCTLFAVLTFIGSIKMLYSGFVLLLALQLRYFSQWEET